MGFVVQWVVEEERSRDSCKIFRRSTPFISGRGGCIAANQLLSNYPKSYFLYLTLVFFSARREYLNVIRVELIAQPLAVDGEDGEVVRGVGRHHDPLPAQTERGGRRQLGSSLECPGK